MLDSIRAAIGRHKSIDIEQARWLFEHADDESLKELACAVKGRFHPERHATYLIMAIINYTNVCVARCDYCSFYRWPGADGGYLLSTDQVCERIDDLRGLGGTLVGFNGGFHPDLHLDHYAEMFGEVRRRYPDMEFYELTVAEFMFIAKRSNLSYAEAAERLARTGTRWVTGGGSEVLTDSFRMR
ncbi:MAG: cyclic dehypoxanthinyl futalosine synthase, partial [Kiritimatiellia bacterium]